MNIFWRLAVSILALFSGSVAMATDKDNGGDRVTGEAWATRFRMMTRFQVLTVCWDCARLLPLS